MMMMGLKRRNWKIWISIWRLVQRLVPVPVLVPVLYLDQQSTALMWELFTPMDYIIFQWSAAIVKATTHSLLISLLHNCSMIALNESKLCLHHRYLTCFDCATWSSRHRHTNFTNYYTGWRNQQPRPGFLTCTESFIEWANSGVGWRNWNGLDMGERTRM